MHDYKQLTHQLFERFSASDIPGVMATMTEDATWLAAGKPALLPAAGLYDKARLELLFNRMFARLKSGLQMKVRETIAEGERVAVEVESSGDLTNGREYRQQYCFVLTFRAGKIASVREYLDTLHAHDTWYRAG